jgi:hypothetical protein
VFKGETPSRIEILLTPIFFTNENNYQNLKGYRASLKEFTKGSIRNELDFYKDSKGVAINFQVNINVLTQAFLWYKFVSG